MTQATAAPPLGRRQTLLILGALMTATFLTALDLTVVGTAMPTIVAQMGGLSLYSWVFTAYLLTSTVTVPLYGKLADLYGRLPVFYAGVIIFLIGSVACGMAQSMEQLILFRGLQGLGAGAVQPLVLTMIGDVFTVEQRARFNALFSAVWGVASVAGPAVGGLLTDTLSWRYIFYLNIPIGIAACVMLARVFPEKVVHRKHQLDIAGALLLTGAITTLLLATSVDSDRSAGVTVGLVTAAAVLFLGFLRVERRAAEPVLPLALFSIPAISIAAVSALLIGALSFATTSFIPLTIQGVFGGNATLAGAMLIPLSIGWPIGSVAGGRVILRWGFRPALLAGVVLIAAGTIPLAFIDSSTSLWWIGVVTTVTGLGLGSSTLATTIAVQNSVEWSQRGVATGAVFFARSMGGSLGVTVLGAILAGDLLSRVGDLTLPAGGKLGIGEVTALLEPSVRSQFDAATLATLTSALGSSLQLVYVGAAVIAVAAVLVALRYPRISVEQLAGGAGAKH